MSELKQYWTEEHYKVYAQIEEQKKEKERLASETKVIDFLGTRKIREAKYNEWELTELYKPIDAKILELEAKFYSIPFKYRDLTLVQQPIVYITEHEEFKLTWSGNQWNVRTTLIGVDYYSIKVFTDEQKLPIKIQFLMLNSETYGKPCIMLANLKEQVDVDSPRPVFIKSKPTELVPTWTCTNPYCKQQNYIEFLACRFCGAAKPVDKKPEPEKEATSKLSRIRRMFEKD